MKPWSAYPIRFLLSALCESPERLSTNEKADAGIVARSLFEFAMTPPRRDGGLIRSAIEAVCRTYDSDPVESKTLLSRLLMQQHLQTFGYEDMPVLAREAQRLVRIAPDFVRDIYSAAFSFEETSDDQTAMGPGRIMPLTSNRRQDYDHSLWQLGETFPDFLKAAPALAVEALVSAINAEVGERSSRQSIEQQFDFNGAVVRIKPDGSYIWDVTQYRHEPHLKMLDDFGEELIRVANDAGSIHAEEQILAAVVEKNHLASPWRRILGCGARCPAGFGKRVMDLACSLPILTGSDTSDLAGNFIKAIYPEIQAEDRTRIENAILSIPNAADQRHLEIATNTRDRLLGCIPIGLLCTEDAKRIVTNFEVAGGPPPNRPPFQMSASFGGPHADDDLANPFVAPIKAFVTAHAQIKPTAVEAEKVLEAAKTLHAQLVNETPDETRFVQIENGWNHLIEFCKWTARSETLDCASDVGRFTKQVLLEGAHISNPAFDEKSAVDFDEDPWWSSAPRIDAAVGLMFLAYKPACTDKTIVDEITSLSKDPVPVVRLQVADHLGALEQTFPAEANKILGDMARHDPSSTVVLSLLVRQIWRFFHTDPVKVGELTFAIFSRTDLHGKQAKELKLNCVAVFFDLFLWKDDKAADELIHGFASDVLQFTKEATRIVSRIREILVAGPVSPQDETCEKARKRAFSVLEAIVSSAQSGFLTVQQENQNVPFPEWSQEDQQKVNSLAQLIDSVSMQLFFASGAHDAKNQSSGAETTLATKEQKLRFLSEGNNVLDLLSKDPHPSTVHHMVQMLQSLLDISPREVFLRLARIVQAGKQGGYQSESLAFGEIVNIMTTMLADYRPFLQADEEMRNAMVSILDTFVEAGWPQAIQLTYRLDEIFR